MIKTHSIFAFFVSFFSFLFIFPHKKKTPSSVFLFYTFILLVFCSVLCISLSKRV
ncbi:hypothetical protein HMPREF9083_0790 [Dialister micraerophilus DSM 19965]|uniref:Uncharacterized protein n=1 Tax=Dialister micraerophilus DSM 19965 TaxID=888062 RepID=F2BXB0_9FIRM|nr:hypothetical protein HMPREF9083_0790 [Dialister micraerophilus DSM 19965]